MNRNEVEQWMKESLGNREYIPGEDAWKKLQEAIAPPAKKNRIPIISALPAGWKAAASVALLVAAGTMIYFITGNNDGTDNTVAIMKERAQPAAPPRADTYTAQQKDEEAGVRPEEPVSQASMASGRKLLPAARGVISDPPSPVRPGTIVSGNTQDPQRLLADPASPSPQKDSNFAIAPTEKVVPSEPVTSRPNLPQDFAVQPERHNNNFNVGVAAQAGRASVGNMRYQVGVVARKDISAKFYTSATIALASTNVTSSEQNTFPSFSVNSVGTSTGGIGNTSIEEKSVEARYGKDIISVGVSPSIGYKVTPRLALAAGLALYRNLDQSLSLKNEESIDRTTLSNNVISSSQQIGKWDAGVTGSASYNVSRKLAVDVQYRYGLSTYMQQGDQAVRNSGMGVGLNYLFGRP